MSLKDCNDAIGVLEWERLDLKAVDTAEDDGRRTYPESERQVSGDRELR